MSIKFKKFEPTQYVMKVKRGKIAEQGLGLSFFYNTMSTSMMVLPATALDTAFTFDDIMTSDFQSVSVQGDISYIISNYEQAAKMVNFAYSENKKENIEILKNAKNQMSKRVINLSKVCTTKFISSKDVKTVMKSSDELAQVLRENLKNNEIIEGLGIEIVSVSILGIMAKPETRKALEAATREEILKQQDDAIYKRRNAAIEQERIVKENELNTEIRVAEKEKEKKEKEMETRRLVMEKQAELDAEKMENSIKIEKKNAELVDLETENAKKKSDAKAYDSEVLLKTFAGIDVKILEALAITGMDPKALIAKAFMEIGDKADKIGVLNVTPDLLDTLTEKKMA
ncbi:MAG: SPFH domain-containing protein [Lachnospiraceae bacterium]|nr:SPFH domain-containing protein [Lachnospiraceae bacterium]